MNQRKRGYVVRESCKYIYKRTQSRASTVLEIRITVVAVLWGLDLDSTTITELRTEINSFPYNPLSHMQIISFLKCTDVNVSPTQDHRQPKFIR